MPIASQMKLTDDLIVQGPESTIGRLANVFLQLEGIKGSILTLRQDVYFWDEESERWVLPEPWELQDAVRQFLYQVKVVKGAVGNPQIGPLEETQSRVQGIVDTVMSLTRVPSRKASKLPMWLGSGEPPMHMEFSVGLRDFVVDLSKTKWNPDGEVRWVAYKRTKEWFDLVTLPCTLEEMVNGEAPTLEGALKQWSEGDEDWIELFLRSNGYILMPFRGYQRSTLSVGQKRSGKSLSREIQTHLLGDECVFNTDQKSMLTSHGLHGAEHARLFVVNELVVGSLKDGTDMRGTCARIIGRDPLAINPKYGKVFDAVLPGHLMMIGNDVPLIEDQADSFWGKVNILAYNVSYLGREDDTLLDRIVAETPGVVRMYLEAALRLIQAPPHKRWPEPQNSLEKKAEIKRLNSPVVCFLDDRTTFDVRMWVSKDDLYAEYEKWCEDYNQAALTKIAFFRALWNSGRPVKKRRHGAAGSQEEVVAGVGLRPQKDKGGVA